MTLRGMTLGELRAGAERSLVIKEAALGIYNSGDDVTIVTAVTVAKARYGHFGVG